MQTADRCRRCGGPGPVHPWRQRFPAAASVPLCAPCGSWLASAADAFASLAEESRILAVARAMAGEVWDAGGQAYCFRNPPLRLDRQEPLLRQRPAAAQPAGLPLQEATASRSAAQPAPAAASGRPAAAGAKHEPSVLRARRNI